MKYVSIVDAKEQLSYLIKLLENPQEEVYLTFNGKPIIKMVPIKEDLPPVEEEKPQRKVRRAGIAKGKLTFDDKLFDSLDAEIWRDIADSYEVNK